MPLEKGLLVAQVADPQCDPAFDRTHPEWKTRVERYVRTRAPLDLAALPLREGRKPRLYEIACVQPMQYGAIRGAQGVRASFFACLYGVTSVVQPSGEVVKPPLEPGGSGPPVAKDEWLRTLQGFGGMRLVEELAACVICRADAGDWGEAEGADPLDLYELPSGWRPAPSRAPAASAAASSSTSSAPPR